MGTSLTKNQMVRMPIQRCHQNQFSGTQQHPLLSIWIADKDISDLWAPVIEFVLVRRFLTQMTLYKAVMTVVFAQINFEKETLHSTIITPLLNKEG
jgi:hypothetical protein